ncbi:ADP-ribosylglycohydrolase family protein [Microbulbifer aggregans]|uniref:ADP-ribosylglycohydrolase family protein n=1 Tax=Microbulbifer aggregans TaxID=1769779 RepID=UPI001CFDF7D3|nr:ADP-ribosylglycohydrolase family protein [Microbulbifer aggregans]
MNRLELSPLQRFQGCLLAGAVGDALGAAVEFMSWAEIQRVFGPEGLSDYAPAYGRIGAITDDTQMTLFTAEGLLRAYVRGSSRGICNPQGVMANAYLRWLRTQSETGERERANIGADGWLLGLPELHSRRAPGNTCLQALHEYQSERSIRAINNSKGCGGVMRVAPVGMFHWSLHGVKRLDETFQQAADFAEITHGHPSGYLPAGVLAVVVQLLLDGQSLVAAITAAKVELQKHSFYEETLWAIEFAEQLARNEVTPHEAISQLGEGWVAEEALAIALYCALTATSLQQGLLMAVNHSGDSDSTGAITGNLMGAQLGIDSIPQPWLDSLELAPEIAEVADDLLRFPRWKVGEYDVPDEASDNAVRKYPGC